MLFNQDETDLKTLSDDLLKQVHYLKHLGSWIADRKKDVEAQIELTWKALNKLDKIWKSKFQKSKIKTYDSVLQIHHRKCFAV